MLSVKLLTARETALQFVEAIEELEVKRSLCSLEESLNAVRKLHAALGNHIVAMHDLLKELTEKNEQQKKG
jgi:hypothetical protein